MRRAIPPLPQYAFIAWRSVKRKAQGRLKHLQESTRHEFFPELLVKLAVTFMDQMARYLLRPSICKKQISPSVPVQEVRNAKYIATAVTVVESGVLSPMATVTSIAAHAYRLFEVRISHAALKCSLYKSILIVLRPLGCEVTGGCKSLGCFDDVRSTVGIM
jgi:hypothetical protein